LLTRNGHDWTDRYPLIVESALLNKSNSFVVHGEAVLLGVDGLSDFDGLHSRGTIPRFSSMPSMS
jgi:bifunctional non-homologous end joining protein LigD